MTDVTERTRPRADPVGAAQLSYDRSLADAFRGRYDLSRQRLRRSLALLPDEAPDADTTDLALRRIRVRLLLLMARVENELSGGEGGRDQLTEATTLARSIGAGDLLFVIEETSALRAMRTGRGDDALAHFSRAEDFAGHADPVDVAKLFLNRGSLRLQRLELTAARRDLVRSLEHLGDGPQSATLATMARHNLGYLEFLRGDLPAALRAMSSASAAGGAAAPAVALLDRARVLIAAGLIDEADLALAQAEGEFRRGRMWPDLAETELARAQCALLNGDFGRARRLAGSARTRFRRRGNQPWRRRSELVLLAGDLGDGRPAGLLVGPATRLATEFALERLPTYAKAARLIACEALLDAGRLSEAGTTFAALTDPQRSEVIELRLHQRTVAARLEEARSDDGAARRQVRLGLTELARHQAQFGSVDLQTASALHGRRLVALDLEMALSTGRPASVFAALERGRALSRRLVPVTPPASESAPLLTELRQLNETLSIIGADPAQTETAALTREEIADRQDQLRRISWRSSGDRSVARHVGLAPVLDLVRARHRQMVLYGRVRGELVAVLLGRGRPRLVALPGSDQAVAALSRLRADLDVQAYPRVPELLRHSALGSARRGLERLDRLLLAPLGLDDSPLVVVPTADLSTVPWNGLPSLVGRAVEVSPTAGAWWHGAQASTGSGSVRVAGFAGPGLAAAEHEVGALGAAWPGAETFTGADATGRAFLQTAGSVDVAHVAAHGTHVAQNPLFSSLQLADGPLFAYELDAAHVPAHVVLSACELGQVTVRPGEETLGLASVLLQLGVRCVVAGVADVHDDLAAEVMAGYHGRLAGGADSATALAEAAAATGVVVPFVCFGTAWSAP